MRIKIFIPKSVKLGLNLSLLLFAASSLNDKSFSLTDYKIKNICKKERRESICIRNLQQKKNNLQKGKVIEIPVIPNKK